jgi:hypothetical protein
MHGNNRQMREFGFALRRDSHHTPGAADVHVATVDTGQAMVRVASIGTFAWRHEHP